jgi:hypothetical protein
VLLRYLVRVVKRDSIVRTVPHSEQGGVMQRMFFKVVMLAAVATSVVYGQSLADIARQNQEKKAAEGSSAPAPRVITNKDLPKDPEADQASSNVPSAPNMAASSQPADFRSQQHTAQQHLAAQHAADQWKRQIGAQKDRVAALQSRIDLVNASIRNAYGSVQYDAPYNRYQTREMLRVEQMQLQLDEQKAKLLQMQEAARHAGMHTLVYDP